MADTVYDDIYNRPTYYSDFEQPTTWSDAMYVLCRVEANGGALSIKNYEIAVYDNKGVLHHCNRSLYNTDGLCMLTIPGERSEELHFKVLFGDYTIPTIVDAENTLIFKANTILGQSTPYVISIGTVNIIGDVTGNSNVNIVDICHLIQILRQLEPANKRADVYEDDVYDLKDLEELKKIILKQ